MLRIAVCLLLVAVAVSSRCIDTRLIVALLVRFRFQFLCNRILDGASVDVDADFVGNVGIYCCLFRSNDLSHRFACC